MAPAKSATGRGRCGLLLPSLLAFAASALTAAETATPPAMNVMAPERAPKRFVALERLDFAKLLPAPPAPGSIAAAADLDTVMQVQAARTPGEIEWAKAVERDDAFRNRTVLGDWFEPARLPVTAAFFQSLAGDLRAVDAASKKPFQRPRPYQLDARVQPCVSLPASSSYPSGSALQALVWAELLGELVPEKRAALLARAHRAAWGRVIGGVHFPTDIEAGRRLAAPFLEACRTTPAFVAAFAAVREEFARQARK